MSKIKFILDFLIDLQNNNNREWYHANKERYKEAHTLFLNEVQAIIASEHFIQLVPLNNYLNNALDFTGNE